MATMGAAMKVDIGSGLVGVGEIKGRYGFPEGYPLQERLRDLITLYNESYRYCDIIATHLLSKTVMQKVKHDSFSRSLNTSIRHLVELLSEECFSQGRKAHHMGRWLSSGSLITTGSRLCSTFSDEQKREEAGHAQQVTYRQYSGGENRAQRRRRKKSLRNRHAIKSWGDLVQEALLMDIYRLYLIESGDERYKPDKQRRAAPGQRYLNDVLSCFGSPRLSIKERMMPTITPLDFSRFRQVVKRYRELSV